MRFSSRRVQELEVSTSRVLLVFSSLERKECPVKGSSARVARRRTYHHYAGRATDRARGDCPSQAIRIEDDVSYIPRIYCVALLKERMCDAVKSLLSDCENQKRCALELVKAVISTCR